MKTDAELMTEFFETNAYTPTVDWRKKALAKYSPDQPRDDRGRFSEGDSARTDEHRAASSAALQSYNKYSDSINSGLRNDGKALLERNADKIKALDAAFNDPHQPERVVSTTEQSVQRGLFMGASSETAEQWQQRYASWRAALSPVDAANWPEEAPVTSDRALQLSLENGTLKPGDVIRDKAYVSTTTDPAWAHGFSAPNNRNDFGSTAEKASGTHVLMSISVPLGTAHLSITNGAWGNESEQLYPRGSGIRVTSISKMPFANMAGEKYPGTDYTYTIHGEYVPPEVSKAQSYWIPSDAFDIKFKRKTS